MKSLLNMLILLLSTGVSSGQNDRWFQTQARVTSLEPVIKTDYVSVSNAHCRQPVLAIARTVAQDIGQQERKQARQLACEADTRPSQKVVGYWVSYEYHGHEGRKYMSQKPADWIPVTVRLEPLRASRNGW